MHKSIKEIVDDKDQKDSSSLPSSGQSLYFRKVADKIKSGELKIAIYGLGHVGSPMASVWLRAGAHVLGVDRSMKVLENARNGKTHVPEPGVNEAFSYGIQTGHFKVYEDPVKASHDSYFKMICVPVLLENKGSADLTAVKEVSSAIGKGLKKDDVVSLNPTVPPGTTEDIILPILEKESRLRVERDFFLIYNPERIYEGRAIEDIEDRYPAIVSGAGPKSIEIGSTLYPLIFRKKGVLIMSNIRTAETEKLLEGIYRDVNIALANELARFCEGVGVNFWEARKAANSQPYSHIHKAGAGVGGACIPVYPQFILHTADKVKIDCRITKMARDINDSMPKFCVSQAVKLLNVKRKLVEDSTISLLGLAFRGGVSDTRLSPTYTVIEEFRKLNAREIRIHDPLVKNDSVLPKEENIILSSDLDTVLNNADLIMIVADHKEYQDLNPDLLSEGSVVYDGRGMLDRKKFDSNRFAAIGSVNTMQHR